VKVVHIHKGQSKAKTEDKDFGKLLREKWERRDRERAEREYKVKIKK
jgi:hypothetical protein